jgi:predicted nucleic acid-binding protein
MDINEDIEEVVQETTDKSSVYIETSVVSYYTSRRSRDLIVAAHQEITYAWWGGHLHEYAVYISQVVLEEIRRGDPAAAADRLGAVSAFQVLPSSSEIEPLAASYLTELRLPQDALYDTLHIALASLHGIDYLVTWNCNHIANAHLRKRLAAINMRLGVSTPIICTPEELFNDDSIRPFII